LKVQMLHNVLGWVYMSRYILTFLLTDMIHASQGDVSIDIKRIVYRLSVYDNICRYEYFKRIGLITFVLFWQGKSCILFSDSQHFMGQFFLNKVKNIYHRTTQSHHTFVDMLHFGMQ